LIVGLGNPGPEYRDTRHNVGFRVVDEIGRRHQLTWAMAPSQVPDAFVVRKYPGVTAGRSADADRLASAASRVAGRPDAAAGPLLLAKPLTFMNRSGEVVAALARYYDVPTADLLIVLDDVDLPFGRLRARQRGSAGTHNGLRSIVDRLGTTDFPRLRLGVGRGDARRDLAGHVLSKFERDETAALESFVARAADAAEMFAASDILKVMNTYNPDDAASGTDN
jgi:PTH1 family peptidyl-tRNA hydrolase